MKILPEEILQKEINTAREQLRPVSRKELAEKLGTQFGMPYKDAIAVVDAFCEEHEPAIPEYLAKEFGVFWLKVVAVANVLVSLGIFYHAVQLHQAKQFPWPWWCGGVLFIGFAVLCWVQSIEKEVGIID